MIRWLSLPRGSGPVLRVMVTSVNVARRRRVMTALMQKGWPPHAVRAFYGFSPAAWARTLSRLPHGATKVLKAPALPLWDAKQLSLFGELEP